MTFDGSSRPIELMPASGSTTTEAKHRSLDINYDGHGQFRSLCLGYGDFYRSVFLEEFLARFVETSNNVELKALRRGIATRAKEIRKSRKVRGRPRVQDDPNWLAKVRVAAFRRIIQGWKWPRIAESEGMKANASNIKTIERTMSRRQDQFARIIWDACSNAGTWQVGADARANLRRLRKDLETPKFRTWLWHSTGLRFDLFPPVDLAKECKKIVVTLAPRGGKIVAQEIVGRQRSIS